MKRTKTTAADPLQEAQAEMSKACNHLHTTRRRLIALASAQVLIRSGFSDDDSWTNQDEFRSCCLDGMTDFVDDLAEQLAKAKADHDKQRDFLIKLRQEQAKKDA